jgi:ketosteroid isomerase-like protein
MSRQNVELHRGAVEAFNARDIEAFIAYLDPSIEFHSSFAAVGGAVYHGHDGLRSWHRDLDEAWGGDIRIEPEGYFDLGEHTLAFLAQHGRGRQSGLEVAMPITHVIRWRDGLVAYWKVFAHRADALSGLGVSEDALERIDP